MVAARFKERFSLSSPIAETDGSSLPGATGDTGRAAVKESYRPGARCPGNGQHRKGARTEAWRNSGAEVVLGGDHLEINTVRGGHGRHERSLVRMARPARCHPCDGEFRPGREGSRRLRRSSTFRSVRRTAIPQAIPAATPSSPNRC